MRYKRKGFPLTGASGFGTSETKGFNLEPKPPERINIFFNRSIAKIVDIPTHRLRDT